MARQRIPLTDAFVRPLAVDKRTDFWDDKVRGLVLRVTPNGVKSWTVIYSRASDGARQRVTLGRYPAITLERARAKALKAMSAVAEGEDPAERKRVSRTAMTVEQLGEMFIEKYAKRFKKSWLEDEGYLKREVYPKIGKMKAMAVRRRDILDIIEGKVEAGFGAASTNLLATMRKMFAWAADNDLIESSPVAGVKPRVKPVRGDRVLSDDELRRIWIAVNNAGLLPAMRDIFKLLILTGQRSGEISGMMRSEVDVATKAWVIPKDRSKNKTEHVVHLADSAMAIVEAAILKTDMEEPDAPLFSRVGKPMASNAVAKAASLKLQVFNQPWTPHDIRRTVATGLGEAGVAPHIIEATLNHISGFRAGVAGVYNRAKYEPEKAAALDLWAKKISTLTK
jgi:integrase